MEEPQLCATDSAAWFEFNSGYFSPRKVGAVKIRQNRVFTLAVLGFAGFILMLLLLNFSSRGDTTQCEQRPGKERKDIQARPKQKDEKNT